MNSEELKGVADNIDGQVRSIHAKDIDTSIPLSGNEPKKPELSKTQQKKMKRAKKNFEKQMKEYFEFNKQQQVKQNKKFKLLKRQVGKDIYNNLKKASTVSIPETKDDQGNVIEAARSVLNPDKFLKELHLAIVVLREDRILKGKRKRTTGRSSERAMHRSTIEAIMKRTEETLKTEEVVDINTVK